MSGNDRSDLKGMLALIAAEAGLAQETAAMITEHLEATLGLIEKMAAHQQSAGALAIAAVGSDNDLPESAQNMVEAASRLGEIINDLRAATQNASDFNSSASRTAGRVAREANNYAVSF
jgi:hypothetical protein